MSLAIGQSEFIFSPIPPLHKHLTPSRHRRWKRRRLKPLTVSNHFNPTSLPFDHFFQSLLPQFPFASTLSYIAPTIGFASGLALYLSSNRMKNLPNPREDNSDADVGEWILFTSPTPFNRFVTLRCPSIFFPGSELLEDVNEKLLTEDRHHVRLSSGRMVERLDIDGGAGEGVVYQRICVSTEDGGVLALDWPANLELEEERGLDTTVVIVPGTAEGSDERRIRLFVAECLRRGLFPIVMNPRGCAGSPLTTARLFTAADSDDVSTAVQYVNKKRPWTTLVGVGWGYGANMLTKYLAEYGERTPLTAATCVDNPFDLEETAKSSVYRMDFGQRHTSGLISILQRNKELFQGRGKGFNVEKALSASSVQDFEESISMRSYGFDSIEDFYEQSSTRHMVGRVKIPLLFIQNDGGTIPLFSVPRSVIAANPYTSLLLCSYSSNKIRDAKFFSSWCHHLTLEWLTAVELGLLKGRHPILEDVDLTINPSMGLALMESKSSSKNGLNLTNGHLMSSPLDMHEADDAAASIKLRSIQDVSQPPKSSSLEKENDGVSRQSSPTIDAEIVEKTTDSVDDERGQVVASAQVVINILDVTMPNILSDEEKKKVLSAVAQGETIMKALQDAVPEDVRGKLTSAVTGIFQSQGSDSKLGKLINLENVPDMESLLNSKVLGIRESRSNVDFDENMNDDFGSVIVDKSSEKPPGYLDVQDQSFEELQNQSSENKKPDDLGIVQSIGNYESPDVQTVNLQEKGNFGEKEQLSTHEILDADNVSEVSVSEINAKSEFPSQPQEPGGTEDTSVDQEIVEDAFDGRSEDQMENNKNKHDSSEVNKASGAHHTKQRSPTSYPAQVAVSGTEGSESPDVQKVNLQEKGNLGENEQLSTHKVLDADNMSEMNAKSEFPSQPQVPGGSENISAGPEIVGDEFDGKSEQMEDNKNKYDSSSAEINASEVHHTEDHSPASSPAQVAVSGTEGSQEEEKETPSISNQNAAAPPSFNVSQAFEALTGFDDSTQVAVSSVFHALEDMIDQLEVEKDTGNEVNSEHDRGEGKGKEEVKEQNHNSPNSKSSESDVDNATKSYSSVDETISQDSSGPEDKHGQQDQLYIRHNSNSHETSNIKPFDAENSTSVMPAAGGLLNRSSQKFPSYSTNVPYGDPLYKEYLKRLLKSEMQKAKPSEWNKMSALHLKYIPEDDSWKISGEHTADGDVSSDELYTPRGGHIVDRTELHSISKQTDDFLEPAYVILDSEKPLDENEEHVDTHMINDDIPFDLTKFDRSMPYIKSLVLERLNVEVGRRASTVTIEGLEVKLARELEQVADAVCLTLEKRKLHMHKHVDNLSDKLCTLDGDSIINAISSAYQDTQYLRRALPVGVVVGSTLAALRKLSVDDFVDDEHVSHDELGKSREAVERNLDTGNKDAFSNLSKDGNKMVHEFTENNGAMVGAFTAALGASAFFAHQQVEDKDSSTEPSKSEGMPDRAQNDIVTSLAEKAMSVASPMVPTKEDGEVDQERVVSMLTELGQKGGTLKLVGKVALLWGGIRSAMSLTDKLISFLHLADRPLFQRIFGFIFMVLLLWSPVFVPLLPSLMQSWATHTPLKIVELACVAGLYISITIMVTLWGKRVRNYDDPLRQYGLDLASAPKFQNFLKGLVGGIFLVMLIHSVNSLLGCVHLRWPTTLPSLSSGPVTLFTLYGRMFLLIVQGIATATAVATVEELLFRSWLPQEIGADLGYHRGLIISGLVFALCQRSIWEIPGLLLLSLSLAGVRQRNQGSLSIPIGLRAGILASNLVLKMGGFLTLQSNLPLWITGGHPFQPFSGVIGLFFSVVLAIILYPEQPLRRRNAIRAIKP